MVKGLGKRVLTRGLVLVKEFNRIYSISGSAAGSRSALTWRLRR